MAQLERERAREERERERAREREIERANARERDRERGGERRERLRLLQGSIFVPCFNSKFTELIVNRLHSRLLPEHVNMFI